MSSTCKNYGCTNPADGTFVLNAEDKNSPYLCEQCANMIHEAPVALNALKIALEFLSRNDIRGTPGLGTAHFEVRKAIARAEGKSQ